MNPSLFRTVEELTVYATERQAGFEAHQGRQARQPEDRNEWIRGILVGMAEVFGTDPGELSADFDYRLEEAHGAFAVVPLDLFGQKHMIQSLCEYVNGLEQIEGDQRSRVMDVKKLLEDIAACLSWDASRSGVYAVREQVESQLLRMVVRRPIRFTRILVGGDIGPGGMEFLSGRMDSVDGVRSTRIFQELASNYPGRKEWPAMCTVCLGGWNPAAGVIDADELDMAVIREAGVRILKHPGITPLPHGYLCVPVKEEFDKAARRAGPEQNKNHSKTKKTEVER